LLLLEVVVETIEGGSGNCKGELTVVLGLVGVGVANASLLVVVVVVVVGDVVVSVDVRSL
jgi:hypothetical protein